MQDRKKNSRAMGRLARGLSFASSDSDRLEHELREQ